MEGKIWDMLICQGLDAIEDIAEENEEYRAIRKAKIQLQKKLETIGLTKEQKEVVQELLEKANQDSVLYGKLAYRQGFTDGAEFMSVLKDRPK